MNNESMLVPAAAAGDAAAFESLVRQHARLVWATIAGMIHNASWIEDLVQETFLRAWKSMDQIREPAAFRAWLLSIARRLAFRHRELMGRSELLEEDPAEPPPTDPEAGIAPEIVQDAVLRLPERYRLPITLRYLHNMSYTQIEKETQISNGALRGLLNRGVKMLRQELRPHSEPEPERRTS